MINYIWFWLGSELKRTSKREAFRKIAERPNKYVNEIKPFDDLCKLVLRMSIKFYSANRIVDGKVQEPIDFFKHIKYHLLFRKYMQENQKIMIDKIEKLKAKFLQNLDAVLEMN